MTKKKFSLSICPICMVEGEIVCTATESKISTDAWHCNRDALTLEEAQGRKKRRDEMWESYIKETRGHRFRTI